MNEEPTKVSADDAQDKPVRWWRSIGPGIIIASVVFGPGSLLTSSKIGSTYGYNLLWLLVATAGVMGAFLYMAARIGGFAPASPCTLIAQRFGRPWAILIGLTVCCICSAFQFGNNLAVATAIKQMGVNGTFADYWLLPILNLCVIVFLFSFKHIYTWIERIAMVMVGVMLGAFAFNLIFKVHPPVDSVLKGLIPSWPDTLMLAWPHLVDGAIIDPMFLVAGFVGTTFVVAGVFLQASLVREKNFKDGEYQRSLSDMLAGVFALAAISAIIMITAGTVLLGKPAGSVGELANQLRPTFGDFAHVLFCLGMLAAALSSLLVNAMMAGLLLADGCGLPAKMNNLAPKLFTVMVLLIGMGVAMFVIVSDTSAVAAIIFGQAITVLGNPLMVLAILFLANSKAFMGKRRNGIFLNGIGGIGLVVVCFLAARVAHRLILQLMMHLSHT